MLFALSGCGGLYKAEPGACVYSRLNEINGPEAFTFTASLPDGTSQSCHDAWAAGPATTRVPQSGAIAGRVSAADATSFEVDGCGSDTGCATETYRFTVQTPGLSLALPVGRQVAVGWSIAAYWGCAQSLVVADSLSTALWFAGTDGAVDTALTKPFSVDTKELSCSAPSQREGCGAMPVDDYAFVFAPLSGDPSLTLATGQTGTLTLAMSAPDVDSFQHLTVHNLRSYQSDRCDDYGNWAWWATGRANASGDPE
jgi:hypothetical protein